MGTAFRRTVRRSGAAAEAGEDRAVRGDEIALAARVDEIDARARGGDQHDSLG
jgi:hypothetical protein